VLAEEGDDIFRTLARDVDADFAHGFDGERMDEARLKTCAERMEAIPGKMPQPSLGHLAAAGVAGAEKEHVRHGSPLCPMNSRMDRSRLSSPASVRTL
jgi:hypothetical protein